MKKIDDIDFDNLKKIDNQYFYNDILIDSDKPFFIIDFNESKTLVEFYFNKEKNEINEIEFYKRKIMVKFNFRGTK